MCLCVCLSVGVHMRACVCLSIGVHVVCLCACLSVGQGSLLGIIPQASSTLRQALSFSLELVKWARLPVSEP